jgi:hypothetical protein
VNLGADKPRRYKHHEIGTAIAEQSRPKELSKHWNITEGRQFVGIFRSLFR